MFIRLLLKLFSGGSNRQRTARSNRPSPVSTPNTKTVADTQSPCRDKSRQRYSDAEPQGTIRGKCYVIDGDTIVIDRKHIRLFGIDAPELEHPWGHKSKWAMVKLCKGNVVTAVIHPEASYDRIVAACFLPDGRDLSAELVKLGLALDWPKYSGGQYSDLEPLGVRKKLWRAAARQQGRMDLFNMPVVSRPTL